MDPDPRIHASDKWIRIRIWILIFSPLTLKTPTTNLKKVFLLFTFEGTLTSFFKDKKSKRSHKTVGIKVFLLFWLEDRRIRIRTRALTHERIRIQEAQEHMDPADPDPQHCKKLCLTVTYLALCVTQVQL